MPQIFRAIATGLVLGAIPAIVLSVYTHRAVPRAGEMRWMERTAWASFTAAVMVGSVAATAALGGSRWLALSDPNARRLLFVAWIVPIAVVLRRVFAARHRVKPNSAGVEITDGTLRTVAWSLQLFVFVILAAAAVALWMSTR